ncbi:MAG TPA: DUF6454 family protein [bacterium]|nr:DUF6454 family protein [bacterium]
MSWHNTFLVWGFLVWIGTVLGIVLAKEVAQLTDRPCLSVVEIMGDFDHVQGIAVDELHLWLTSVHRQDKTGFLHKYNRQTGALIRHTSVHENERYHPGGIALEGDSLWIPVAAYSREGSSSIEQRDTDTLERRGRFFVDDHIGCLAVTEKEIIGANWDARVFYFWDHAGVLIKKVENPLDARYQDMQCVNGILIASGLEGGRGVVDWLSVPDLKLLKRIEGGKTNRGIHYMNEGMAVFNNQLFLLPEDGPISRLFVFALQP